MNLFLKIKSIIGLILAVTFAFVFILESYSVLENSTGYYYISSQSREWQYQSINYYHTWCLICAGVSLLYAGISVLSLFLRKRKFKYILLIFDIILEKTVKLTT